MWNRLAMFSRIFVSFFSEKSYPFFNLLIHSDTSTDLTYDGKMLHVSLIPNPSHLEVLESLFFRSFYHFCLLKTTRLIILLLSEKRGHVNYHWKMAITLSQTMPHDMEIKLCVFKCMATHHLLDRYELRRKNIDKLDVKLLNWHLWNQCEVI